MKIEGSDKFLSESESDPDKSALESGFESMSQSRAVTCKLGVDGKLAGRSGMVVENGIFSAKLSLVKMLGSIEYAPDFLQVV
jgi:hypothetical protein